MSEINVKRGPFWVSCPRADFFQTNPKDPASGIYVHVEWAGIRIKAARVKNRIAVLVFSRQMLFDKSDGMYHGQTKKHEFRKWYTELPPVHQILEDLLAESKDDYFRDKEAFSIGIFIKKSEIGEVFNWQIDPF